MGSTKLKKAKMNPDIFTRAQDWIYLVIAPSGDNQDAIRNANPFRVNNFLKFHCTGESLREVKAINMGRQLLVVVKNKETADVLVRQKSIPGPNKSSIPVIITESDRLGTKQGVFFCRHTEDMSDEEIIDNLNASNPEMKIVAIRRLKRRNTDGSWIDSGSYVVTMKCSKIPEEIKVGWTIQAMRPFIPDPMRCFRCNRLGHTGKRCREKKEDERNCINCNQPHHTEPGNKCVLEPKCANCHSNEHNSAFRGCPNYILDKRVNEIMVTRGYTRRQASAIAINEPTPPQNHNHRKPITLAQRLQNAIATTYTPQQKTPPTNNSQTKPLPKNTPNTPIPNESDEFSDIEMTTEEKISLTSTKINEIKQKILQKRGKSLDSHSSEDEINKSKNQIKKMKKEKAKAAKAAESGQPPGTSLEQLNGQGKGVPTSNNNGKHH